MKFLYFCDLLCIPLSFLLLSFIFVFSFAEKFLEVENAGSFLHFKVSCFKLCDKA